MTEVKIMRRKARSPMVGLRLTKAPQGTSPAAQVKPTVSYAAAAAAAVAAAVDFHVLPLQQQLPILFTLLVSPRC